MNVPESEPEALKREMWARLTEARYPPAPDAMCRIDMCLASFREIRWDPTKTDEVYHRIECDSKWRRCVLDYHKKCHRRLIQGIGPGDSLLGREWYVWAVMILLVEAFACGGRLVIL